MRSVQLRQVVQKEIGQQWPAFAEKHPHLAAAIDQRLLVEQAMQRLCDDPAYREAMEQASVSAVGIGIVGDMVRGFVREWLGRL